jgi:hypothetical protein
MQRVRKAVNETIKMLKTFDYPGFDGKQTASSVEDPMDFQLHSSTQRC